MGLVNYLPTWLDRRESNTAPVSGAAAFFAKLKQSMMRAIPIRDDLGFAQNSIWVLALASVAWLLLPKK